MKFYKLFLLINALLMINNVALAAGVSEVFENHGEFKKVEAAPYFELILMGGIAALSADNSIMHITDSEIDKLVQGNDDWGAFTAAFGAGYVIPLSGTEFVLPQW